MNKNNVLFFLAIFLVYFLYTIAYKDFLGNIPYFHVQYTNSYIFSNANFSNLPFSIYSNNYIDHHFLWHILLKPFVYIDKVLGSKFFVSLQNTILVIVLYNFLSLFIKNSNDRKLAILCFVVGSAFTFRRMLMVKIYSTFVILILLSLYFVYKNQKGKFFITNIIFPLTYGGFVINYFLLPLLFMFSQKDKWYYLLLLFIANLIGIICHPDLLHYFVFINKYFNYQFFDSFPIYNAEYIGLNLYQLILSERFIFLYFPISIYFFYKDKELRFYSCVSCILFFSSFFYSRILPYSFIFFSILIGVSINRFSFINKNMVILYSYILFSLIINTGFVNSLYTYHKPIQADARNSATFIPDKSIIFNAIWSDFDLLFYENNTL